MKSLTIGLLALGLIMVSDSARAQCGCCGASYPPPMPMPQMSVQPLPAPAGGYMSSSMPGTVSFVNKLAQPIDRGTYTLKYAIHMSDGRILLADFLPRGQTIRGTETRSSGGRKLATSIGSYGAVTVKDPDSSQVIAQFDSFTR